MKYKVKYIIIASLLCIFVACHSHSENDGHNHDKKETGPESKEPHKHEKEVKIVSLTEEQIQTVGIEYGSIENKQLTATLKANGALRVPNNNKANATSMYGGVVKTLQVQVGSHVSKGQVIATIANPQFIQLQEEYLSIGSKIVFAEQELTRQKELNAGNAGALKNLQSAEAEVKSLRTRKASLQQQIQLMGFNPNSLSNHNLRSTLSVISPINGTVSTVFSKIGSYVDVSSPVAEIVDNNQLHLDLNVFEKDLPMLRVGQIIHFTLTNNAINEYDAKIYSIGTSFENDSKTIPIHATVQGNKSGLIDGMNITAIVSLSIITAPAVPDEAIVSHNGKEYIFIITNKEPEEQHGDGEHEHNHKAENKTKKHIYFEKIEVGKGVSNMGHTAISLVTDIPAEARIVTKGAFFINAKITNQGEAHEH